MRGLDTTKGLGIGAWLTAAIGIFLALAALAFTGPAVLNVAGSFDPAIVVYKDFRQEFLLARAVADGLNPYVPLHALASHSFAPEYAEAPEYPTPHPPSVAIVFRPLTLLDYGSAARVWLAIEGLSLAAGLGLALRGAGVSFRWWWIVPLCVVLVGWAPISTDLLLGQLTLPILLVLSIAQLAFARGHAHWGGVLLGLSLALKPLAWPWVLVLLWRRCFSAIAATVSVVLGLFALTALQVGLGPVMSYFTVALPTVSSTFSAETTNISLWTLGPRLFRGIATGGLAGTPPLLLSSPSLANLIGWVVPVAVAAVALVWMRRRVRADSHSPDIAFALMTGISILVSPTSWQYNVLLGLLPLAHVLRLLHGRRYPLSASLALVAIGPLLFMPDKLWSELAKAAGAPAAPLPALLTLAPAIGIAGLLVLLARLSSRCARCAPETAPARATVRSGLVAVA